jgi:hypothetical protein
MRWQVSDLPAFGLLLLPRPVPGSLSSEAYQSQMQVASVKQSNVYEPEKKLITMVQGHECLYNLQHKDYNSLVKDSSWEEIAG